MCFFRGLWREKKTGFCLFLRRRKLCFLQTHFDWRSSGLSQNIQQENQRMTKETIYQQINKSSLFKNSFKTLRLCRVREKNPNKTKSNKPVKTRIKNILFKRSKNKL